jgi:predicted dehydrogenase
VSDPTAPSALVIGSGSIGARHLRNLRAIGARRLFVWDPDLERARGVAAGVDATAPKTLDEALGRQPEVVFVCSPPAFHLAHARDALEAGAHVFIEKPLSHTLEGTAELGRLARENSRVVQVGYNFRFHPAIRALKRAAADGTFGRPLWLRAEFGQYLPDWRPATDYRTSYTARRDLGGGIVLDGSHEIDYALWVLGEPTRTAALVGKVSSLEMDVEDCASVALEFESGAQAEIHLDCVQRAYTRAFRAAFEQATLAWSFGEPVRLFEADRGSWRELAPAPEANEMYVEEVRHFLACAATGERPLCDLEAGRRTLEVALRVVAGSTGQ